MSDTDVRAGVSYVMPVLNEASYVEAAISSILAQDYDGPVELVVALGPSVDGTRAIVDALAAGDDRIQLVENHGRDIPIGLNLAIRACRYSYIVRVDAHAELEAGYTARGIATLERTGAASVGGVMFALGRPGFQAAVARAYNSPLGLGGGSYHRSTAREGPAESAYLGIMRAEALDAVGYFDETLRRGEDWELNYRLRRAGWKVWRDADLRVRYWPRETPLALARQFFATGAWRAELVRRLGFGNPVRFFAPPALVVLTALALIAAPFQVLGLLPSVVAWLAVLPYLGVGAYLVLLLIAAARTDGAVADRLRFAGAIAVMHFSWGSGFLRGLAFGAGAAVDTSRSRT